MSILLREKSRVNGCSGGLVTTVQQDGGQPGADSADDRGALAACASSAHGSALGAVWAVTRLASGDQRLRTAAWACSSALKELSRTRARAPRSSTLLLRKVPRGLRGALERDAALVRTGARMAACG